MKSLDEFEFCAPFQFLVTVCKFHIYSSYEEKKYLKYEITLAPKDIASARVIMMT